MNTSTATNGHRNNAEDILKQAKQATAAQEPLPNCNEPKEPSRRPNPPQSKSLIKASERKQNQSAEAIQKYVDTSKTLENYELKKGLERGKKQAQKQVEAEQIGYIQELTSLRVQATKSRQVGLDAIDQQIDETLTESKQFKSLFEDGDADPLEEANELFATAGSLATSIDIFRHLGS